MRADLCQPVEQVAPRLLGAVIRHGPVAVRLTELEAYDGATDPASHAYRGRTPRNAVMFGPPGHLYLYFTYGMHWAGNISCGPEGVGCGVLMRAGEVVEGVEVARSRRGQASDRDLARGPGRLTQALGLHAEQKGCDLLGDGPVTLEFPAADSGDDHVRAPSRGFGRSGSALAILDRRQPLRVGLQAQSAGGAPRRHEHPDRAAVE